MNNKYLKQILMSLSLANIMFAGSWRMYLYPPFFLYGIENKPNWLDYAGIMLAVILLAGLFFGSFRLFKYFYEEKADLLINLAFLTTFLFGLNIFRLQFSYSSYTYLLAIISQVLFLLLIVIAFTKWQSYVISTVKTIVLLLSPFVFITFSQSMLGAINHDPKSEIVKPFSEQIAEIKPGSASEIKSRVVWIIFDEFDYRVPFDLKAVEMPEFDRLKETSLTATNATSPAYDTLESIPSLVTGKKVSKSIPNDHELILNFADGTDGNFSEETNIFGEVKKLGGETAINGFYHSYCRVIGKDLSACHWKNETYLQHTSLISSVISNYKVLFNRFQYVFTTDEIHLKQTFNDNFEEDKLEIQALIEERPKRMEDIYQVVTNPNLDLVFIHLPIPHPPAKFNRHTGKYQLTGNDYLDNLALTDIVLGEIRKAMEDSGQWDNSTFIVSTDHQLRTKKWIETEAHFTGNDLKVTKKIEDERIPFFIKLKNQDDSIVYEKPFNTIITKNLILAIMNDKVQTSTDLKNWIDYSTKNN